MPSLRHCCSIVFKAFKPRERRYGIVCLRCERPYRCVSFISDAIHTNDFPEEFCLRRSFCKCVRCSITYILTVYNIKVVAGCTHIELIAFGKLCRLPFEVNILVEHFFLAISRCRISDTEGNTISTIDAWKEHTIQEERTIFTCAGFTVDICCRVLPAQLHIVRSVATQINGDILDFVVNACFITSCFPYRVFPCLSAIS